MSEDFYHSGRQVDGKFIPSEKKERMYGRSTGWTGTGVYMVSSPLQLAGSYLRKDRTIHQLRNPWKGRGKPLFVGSLDEYDRLSRFSQLLWEAEEDERLRKVLLELSRTAEKKGMECTKDPDIKRIMKEPVLYCMSHKVIRQLPVLTENIETALDQAKTSEAQPINFYLKSLGYAGVEVQPRDDILDNTIRGSVVHCEEACIPGEVTKLPPKCNQAIKDEQTAIYKLHAAGEDAMAHHRRKLKMWDDCLFDELGRLLTE